MTGVLRVSFLALCGVLAAAGCSSENPPATNNGGNGGNGAGASGGTGGSGAEPGTGGTGGDPGTGGSDGGTGGSSGSTGGTGGGNTDFSPQCDLSLTVAGEEIAKGVVCAPEDPQLCWRKCGPQGSGWKSETCSGGVYAEGDCVFPPDGDYACFKLPEPGALHAECPTDPALMPQASEDCTVPECNPCNVDGQYKTSSAEVKVGWCVCQPPNNAGTRTWTCASGTAWPCPLGNGC